LKSERRRKIHSGRFFGTKTVVNKTGCKYYAVPAAGVKAIRRIFTNYVMCSPCAMRAPYGNVMAER
jgi:hypothetical protein